MSVRIVKMVFNPFSMNTYIIFDDLKNSIIVDPGCSTRSEQDRLVEFCRSNSLSLKYIINTHCHVDHVLGNAFIKQKFNSTLIIPEEDKFLLDMMVNQGSMFGMNVARSPEPDQFISENLILDLPFKMIFLHTPGHTPGEYCIYFPEEQFCITGDVLFKEGIGRTDLWGGNYETLISSIKSKLFTLPDETVIYPGHGEQSTIGYEKNNNPFL